MVDRKELPESGRVPQRLLPLAHRAPIYIFLGGAIVAGMLSYIANQRVPHLPAITCSDFNPYTCRPHWRNSSVSLEGFFDRSEDVSPTSIREQGKALGLSSSEIELSIGKAHHQARARELSKKLQMPADFVERNFELAERVYRSRELAEKLDLPPELVQKNLETIEQNLPSVDPAAVQQRCKCIADKEKEIYWEKNASAKMWYRISTVIVVLSAVPLGTRLSRRLLPLACSMPARGWRFILRRIREIAAAIRGDSLS